MEIGGIQDAKRRIGAGRRFLALAIAASFIQGCVSTICGGRADCRDISPEQGRLVRYHLGIVREVTPAISSPEKQVFASDLATYGLWLNVDSRPAYEEAKGVGVGLGYNKTRRDIFPKDCSFIVYVEEPSAVKPVVDMFQKANLKGDGACVISKH